MALSDRENYLRNISMSYPEWMPCHLYISPATWIQFQEEIKKIQLRYPTLFNDFKTETPKFDEADLEIGYRENEVFTDSWRCTWRNAVEGIDASVTTHPLENWENFDTYEPPDPLIHGEREPADWKAIQKEVENRKKKGELTPEPYPYAFCLPHGFFFQRLQYLRGFENLMYDYVDEPPKLSRLIDMLIEHNLKIINKWLSMGVDLVTFGEDLGSQASSIISPEMFRKWISPAYKSMMQICRDAGCHVYLHSDGYIMNLIDDLIEAGVTIINPQDVCNGIDAIAKEIKGRICISLDIDRQKTIPFGSPSDIIEIIEEEVRKLGSAKGGLELVAGIYPPTPPENIEALCCAFEKFRTFWFE